MSPRPYLSFQVALTLLYFLSHLITPILGQIWIRVDDTSPGISYSGVWQQGPCGDPCLSPDLSNVYNETWHVTWPSRSTGASSLTFSYTGYACVVGGFTDDVTAGVVTAAMLTLDGKSFSSSHVSNDTGEVVTSAVFLNSGDLPLGLHTLTISVDPDNFFALDYIAIQTPDGTYVPPASNNGGGNTGGTGSSGNNNNGGDTATTTTTTSHSTQSSSNPTTTTTTSNAITTSNSVITGPSGTTTVPITITLPTSTGSLFDPSTLTGGNILAHTLEGLSTSTDASGHSFIVPISTYAGDDPAFTRPGGSSNGGVGSTSQSFSPALAGAIGAAVAALSAVLIVVSIFLCKRKTRRQLRSGDAEPYILAASATPSTASSSLSPPLSPMPYSPQSVLGLFVGPQAIPDQTYPLHPQQQFDLLASPPPNTLSTPLSPNQPYSYPVTHKIISSSNSRGLTPRRQDMAELRSPITPVTIQRPNDWDIEGHAGIGAGMVYTPVTPITGTPSPIVTTPTSHPSRRRSGRQKEQIETLSPPPPLPNVPVLRPPNVPRRSRRANLRELPNVTADGNADGRRDTGSGIGSDEESLPPVVRRQSFTHPAPPAYSPPRLIRNADLHFE